MSDVYQRPLAALFLADVPVGDSVRKLPDFRRPAVQDGADPASLQKAIMRAYRQRDALAEIADELGWDDDGSTGLVFEGGADVEACAAVLRRSLRMSTIPSSVRARPQEFLRELVRRAEDLGITVIQVQRVPVDRMRGFAIGDGRYPIVALNGADWPRGKIFTLLHELSHVGFKADGLCDLENDHDPTAERICEQIAAAALMPEREFNSVAPSLGAEFDAEDLDILRALGDKFGASSEAALLRMIELGRAAWADYERLKPGFRRAYERFKQDEAAKNEGREVKIFYQLKVRDLGRRFVRQVIEAHRADALSSRDAAQLLEVSYDKIPKLAGAAGEVSA